jgi:hypothetical protein
MKGWLAALAAYASLFIVYVYFFGTEVQPADWMQIMLLTALVGVTIFYAWTTHRQAEASVKTVEKMKEQTVIASRPLIIHKAIVKSDVLMQSSSDRKPWLRSKYFSHFLIKNVGNGPAIELEIALLDKNKNLLEAHRETYLRPGEEIDFGELAVSRLEESTYYIVCEYRIVFPFEAEKTWEQTWLPFRLSKATKEGEIYVAPGELDFCKVTDKDRIAAFGSSKPA